MSHNLQVSYDDLIEAKAFYYIDTTDEKHPFNLMNGPLDTHHLHQSTTSSSAYRSNTRHCDVL